MLHEHPALVGPWKDSSLSSRCEGLDCSPGLLQACPRQSTVHATRSSNLRIVRLFEYGLCILSQHMLPVIAAVRTGEAENT